MNEGLNYDERKQWAKVLYTKENKTIRDIALEVNIDEAAVRNWVKENAWDGIKRSLLISKSTQLEHFYGQIDKLNARIADSPDDINTKEVDQILKYTAAIKNLEADVSVCQVIEVAELFISWLRRKDIALTKAVTVKFDAFIKQTLAT
jgi:hypothetical protein